MCSRPACGRGLFSACRSSRARLHASLGDTPFTPRAGTTRIAAVKSQTDPHEAEATLLSERTQSPIKRALSTGGPTVHDAEATLLSERTRGPSKRALSTGRWGFSVVTENDKRRTLAHRFPQLLRDRQGNPLPDPDGGVYSALTSPLRRDSLRETASPGGGRGGGETQTSSSVSARH